MMNNIRTGIRGAQNLPGDAANAIELQQWNIRRKYAVGFRLAFAVGVNSFPQIKFPGMARMMLGFTLFDDSANPGNLATINLNNENIITDTSWTEYTKVNQFNNALGQVTGSSYKDEYYPYPRALSGNDGVLVTYKTLVTGNLNITFYYKSVLDLTVV